MKRSAISGRQYNSLRVLGQASIGQQLICRCDCGQDCLVTRAELESGSRKDCGHSTPITKTESRFVQRSQAEGQRLGEQLLAEAEQERMKPIRELEARTNNVLQSLKAENDKLLKAFWSQPLQTIAAAGIAAAPLDPYLTLPTNEAARDGRAEFLAYKAAKDEAEKAGVTLSDDGWSRLGSYLQCQAAKLGSDISNSEAWLKALVRLNEELDVFAADELPNRDTSNLLPLPVVELEAEPASKTLDDMFRETGDSRADDQRLKNAVENDFLNGKVEGLFRDFYEHVRDTFKYTLNAEQLRWIDQYFQQHNLSPMKPANFDTARRAAVQLGIMPSSLLTVGNILEDQYKRAEISDADFLRLSRLHAADLDKPRAALEV